MSIVCVATNRITTTVTEGYVQMADQSPGPGNVKARPLNVLIDFTDPHRVLFRQTNSSIEFFIASRGDIIHGFPHHQTMTNFIQWHQYFICFSDGLIWAINEFTKTWNVVAVRNSEDYDWQPSSRHDFLYAEEDRMTLVKFLPNRANCERVILHEYTLFDQNDAHSNTVVNPQSNSFRSAHHPLEISRSTDSSTAHSDNEHRSYSFSLTHGGTDTATRIFHTNSQISTIASQSLLTSENDEKDDTSTIQPPTTVEPTNNSDHGSNYSSCKICLIEYGNRSRSAIIPCGHLACSNCIRESMKENNRCPFCRKNIEHTLRLYE